MFAATTTTETKAELKAMTLPALCRSLSQMDHDRQQGIVTADCAYRRGQIVFELCDRRPAAAEKWLSLGRV